VIVDGILAPGTSIGALGSGNLTFNDNSTFSYGMDSSAALPAELADLQSVDGNLVLAKVAGNVVHLILTDLAAVPAAFAPDTTLTLVRYAGAWNNGYFTYGSNELVDGEQFTAGLNTWTIHYGADTAGMNFASVPVGGSFINLSNSLTSIPEPGSLLALGCLIGSGALLRTRRRKP